jgi:hypothetical protein
MSTIPEPAPAAAIATSDDNVLLAERRDKLAAIRARGVAFPNDFKPGTAPSSWRGSTAISTTRRSSRRRSPSRSPAG